MKKKKVKVINIVGARPNFMKIAPLMEEYKKHEDTFDAILLHTGQHYDEAMSRVFFEDLSIPKPDINLEVGSGSHTVQTANIMLKFEEVVLKEKPDLILVVGDVNSTVACSLVGAKLGVPIAHVEAGLRSFDRTMPEEINRIVTDSLSDILFTTSEDADVNLEKEGVSPGKIHFTGNVMIDTLLKHKERADALDVSASLGLKDAPYAVLTLHRPSNVDIKENFEKIINSIKTLAKDHPFIFPVHPRTRRKLKEFSLDSGLKSLEKGGKINGNGIWLTDPIGYIEFLALISGARAIFTDSGGIQEETTILGVNCLTLRENTERPVTITDGTNTLVGTDPEKILEAGKEALSKAANKDKRPKLWDGHAAERIVKILMDKFA